MKELKGIDIRDFQSRRLSENEWEELRQFAQENNSDLKENDTDLDSLPENVSGGE